MPIFKLDTIIQGIQKKPIKFFLYGANGVGKTHVSGQFPHPIFMDLEDGLAGQDYSRQPITSFDEAKAFISFLKEAAHPFKTLVIDSMDRLEKLAYPKACEEEGLRNLYEGYGKGLVCLEKLFLELRDDISSLIATRPMNVIFISHEKIRHIQMLGRPAHDLIVPALHDRLWPIFADWCNLVGQAYFLLKTQEVHDLGFNKKQVIASQDHKTFESGSRLLRVDPSDNVAICKNRFRFNTLIKEERIDTYSIPFSATSILGQIRQFYKQHEGEK